MKLTKHESLLMDEVSDNVGDAEEDLAASVFEDSRFKKWVSSMRETYIVNGFFVDWYGVDGRLGRIKERQGKSGHLFRDERSAFLFWLRLGTGHAANNIWHETMTMLKILDMDCSEYLTRMMFPLFSKRDVAVIFEAVGRPRSEAEGLFHDVSPFLAPPPWVELLNYAFFDCPLYRLPVYRLVFADDFKLSNIAFIQPDLSERARSWIMKEVSRVYEKLNLVQERSGQHLKWWLLNNSETPAGVREIARKYGKPASTVSNAIKTVKDNLLEENKTEEYMRAVPTVGGISWSEVFEITDKTLLNKGEKQQPNSGKKLSLEQTILFMLNIADLGADMISTKNYSSLGVRPIPDNILQFFVHQKTTK